MTTTFGPESTTVRFVTVETKFVPLIRTERGTAQLLFELLVPLHAARTVIRKAIAGMDGA